MLDISAYYKKLADQSPLSEEEIVAALKELAHFRMATAYLSSCQGATLAGLPKSASKSARARHVSICETAAKLLAGDASGVRFPDQASMTAARERCLKAAADNA